MDSIAVYTTQPSGILVLYPWTRANVGVRLKGGGLRYLPWAGFLRRDWLPRWALPCAVAVNAWGVGASHGSDQKQVHSGFIVGAIIEGRVWAVLYGAALREA